MSPPARTVLTAILLCASAVAASAGDIESLSIDRNGQVQAMLAGGAFHDVGMNIRLAGKGWKQHPSLNEARDVRREAAGDRRIFRGRLLLDEKPTLAYEETVEPADGGTRITFRLTALRDAEIAGVFVFFHLPVEMFARGRATAMEPGEKSDASTVMPAELPEDYHFAKGTARGLEVVGPGGEARVRIVGDAVRPFVIQDHRKWGHASYSAYFRMIGGELVKGETTDASFTLALAAPADKATAKLRVEPQRKLYRLDGFGGNFCYGVDSPVTRHNVETIGMGWARVGVKLDQWEQQNDNDDPNEMNWAAYESRDKPGTQLRADFLMARKLAELKVPYIASAWRVPEFVTARPGQHWRVRKRVIPREKWPEALECVGSYLLYLKRAYDTEPEMFSFNESDIGCFVLMDAEEHRDWNKACGAYLARLGLKTKVLLADSAKAKVAFAEPTIADPQALKHCAAVAFHTWHKGPEVYRRWRKLADRIGLPLMTTEVGPDAMAWKNGSYRGLLYYINELRMYQEILLHARPRAVLEWEYTADYRMLEVEEGPDGRERLRPTPRYWMIRQFANLTPRPARGLATSSDHPKVLLTAFADEAGKALVLHIANCGAARRAELTGLPAGVKHLAATGVTWTAGRQKLTPVAVRGRAVALDLAEFSLLTLVAAGE